MTILTIENTGKDIYHGHNQTVGSNVIQVDLAEKKFEFPMVTPHQSELEKAQNIQMPLESPLGQFVYRVEAKKKVTSKTIQEEIANDYSNFLNNNPNLLCDIYFQYWQEYPPTEAQRDAILAIQETSDSLIISDYEPDTQQSLMKFAKQMENLLTNYGKKHIVSPTLDIAMKPVELFEAKLRLLPELGIKRFSVIYRSLVDEQDNWITLSHEIFGKDIWCNVVGIPQRFYSISDPFSLISTVFLYGVHTASLGYPRFPKKKNKKNKSTDYPSKNTTVYNLKNSHYFEPTNNLSDEESRVISFNKLVEELKLARKHIRAETYYSKFVKERAALYQTLQTIT